MNGPCLPADLFFQSACKSNRIAGTELIRLMPYDYTTSVVGGERLRNNFVNYKMNMLMLYRHRSWWLTMSPRAHGQKGQLHDYCEAAALGL